MSKYFWTKFSFHKKNRYRVRYKGIPCPQSKEQGVKYGSCSRCGIWFVF